MKALIIGNGGREHAIAWKLAQDPRITHIYVAPGNGGTASLERAENLALTDSDALLQFARNNDIGLTFVGSEAWLVDGIVDRFQAAGLNIFGPHQAAAMLEGSKRFAKAFMQKYGVKTAAYQSFDQAEQALAYLKTCPYPTVVKASGLAAGKGVIICQNQAEAEKAVRDIMLKNRFGAAGTEIVIEEFLEGFEVSILSLCDGKNIVPLKSAKDHKTIGEYNQGENTGGMGVVAPHPSFTPTQYQAFIDDIMLPTLRGIQAEQLQFAGIIFFGLMVNERGVFLLEYNMRLGDPETQAVLSLMQSSLLDAVLACIDGKLADIELQWSPKHAVCLVAASGGYPNEYAVGLPISGVEKASCFAKVFIAGAKKVDNGFLSSGGRVLNVVALGDDLGKARTQAYSALEKIQFERMTYRKDIGEIPS